MDIATHSENVGHLYQHHHGWLVGLLRRKLGNLENAHDIAQDTFIRILGAGELVELREPRAYLTTIATRLTAQLPPRSGGLRRPEPARKRDHFAAHCSKPPSLQCTRAPFDF